jgi:hypothetical protein
MGGFVQVIEMRTHQFDEIDRLEKDWLVATEGRRTLRRHIVARDRNDPTRYLIFAFFDSYESALENSDLPETGKFAAMQSEFLDDPLTFTDLDVVADEPA